MSLHITDNADLSALNAFGVAARAQRLIELAHEADADQAVALAHTASRTLLLGAGSNLLFASDFDGTIVRITTRGRTILESGSVAERVQPPTVLVDAAAGEPWHEFVLWTLSQSLYGLENLALIPGSVGAAPVQNIGAYGVELREHVHSVEAISLDTGERQRIAAADCEFAYRSSRFRRSQAGSRWLILSVRFALSRTPCPRLTYPDLRTAFANRTEPPTPEQIADAVCAIRRRKLPDPAKLGNAGSFFRNPVISAARAQSLQAQYPQLPAYPDPSQPGQIKIAAAWLIERCGWKGVRRGDAGVHANHALVLVNHGSARGSDIAALAAEIRESVAAQFGVSLEPEVVIV